VVEEGAEVRGLRIARGRATGVDTDSGAREAADVVVALGPWSAPFLRPLGLRLPIQPGKGYSLTWSRPSMVPAAPLVLREHSVCVTAWADGMRLGSTMEFSGYDARLNRTRLDAIVRAARAYLREPTGPVLEEEWYGWRPMTPDDLPLVGAAPGRDGLWLATGHGMMGMGMSAITGQLLAALLAGTPTPTDPLPVDPARF
jgi:D-amino-acid dehydrogenase